MSDHSSSERKMGDNARGKPPKKRNWTRIALVVSLSLNLLVVGVIAGSFWMWRQSGWHDKRANTNFIARKVLRHLPEDKLAEVMVYLNKRLDGAKDRRQKLRAVRRALGEKLSADQFNEEEVRAVAENLSRLHAEQRSYMTTTIVGIISMLTPEQRKTLLKRRFFRHLFSQNSRSGYSWRY